MADSGSVSIFEILAPRTGRPRRFNSPHSGNTIRRPPALTRLSPAALRKSEDRFIDELS
jgi:N-formylglutamate amidohydrolase